MKLEPSEIIFFNHIADVLSSEGVRPTGSFVPVLDGTTIEVPHNHHPEHIRLNGIDCPEKGRAW
jgi:endonuclease YncB( thermonuclease family)